MRKFIVGLAVAGVVSLSAIVPAYAADAKDQLYTCVATGRTGTSIDARGGITYQQMKDFKAQYPSSLFKVTCVKVTL